MDNTHHYAGIGSRETPAHILSMMTELATLLDEAGWTLRSGGATGADSAFAGGATRKEIYRPRGAHTPESAYETAWLHHPAWDRCTPYTRHLLARNVQIILGPELNQPARIVFHWRPESSQRGGTLHAITVAKHYGIPCMNVEEHGVMGCFEAAKKLLRPVRRRQPKQAEGKDNEHE